MGICESKNHNNKQTNQKRLTTKTAIHDTDHFIPNMIPRNSKMLLEEYLISDTILGSGSYGEVRLATNRNTNEQRAVKIIIKENCTEDEYQKIFKEVKIMQEIDHPNIIKIYEFFENDQYIFIVMELMSQGELFDMIHERKRFTESKAAEIMRDILSAVNYLHKKGIVHRDLKPENILISQQGVLKVVDFGTSKFYTNKKMTAQHGTPYYIAPEVLKEHYTEKCDVWSCGVILYILLSGTPPFNGKNDKEIMQKVAKGKFDFNKKIFLKISNSAKQLISKMLQKNFKKRISAEQALKDKWFMKASQYTTEIDDQALQNLKNFQTKNKIQQAIYFFFVNQILSQEDREHLIQMFKQFDKNNDGVLSREELEQGFQKKNIKFSKFELDNLFKALDNNQNDQIDYMEFVAAAINRKELLTEQKIRQCFKLFDKNNSNTIELSELKMVFSGNQEIDEKVWQDLLLQIEQKSKNDQISYEDFKNLLLSLINKQFLNFY